MKVLLFRDYTEENWHSMEVYADNLADNLIRFYGNEIQIRQFTTLPRISKYFPSNHKHLRHIFRYIVNPSGVIFQKADVYHITDHANAHLLATLDPKRTVVTCHDLTAPYWMMTHVKPTIKKRIKHAIEAWRLAFMKKAARIIAVSEATKQDIVHELHIHPGMITVIPEGAEATFHPVNDKNRIQKVAGRYRLPAEYILHVGTTYYNKNIEGLFSLFFSLARQNREIRLVKAGDEWTSDQEHILASSPFKDRVQHVGFVETSDLPVLYSRALFLLQPSYAEGFGLTVLEAMACGCPVVVSDIPAHREMVGSGGLYVSSASVKNDVQNVAALLADARTRAMYRRIGLLRSKQYSWEKCARRTYRVYREVLLQKHL